MTKNFGILCFELFCKFFNGKKYGEVYPSCNVPDKFSTIDDGKFELFTDEDSVRLCVGGRYVMILYNFKIGIYTTQLRSHTFENSVDFLNYFKIPFVDIV